MLATDSLSRAAPYFRAALKIILIKRFLPALALRHYAGRMARIVRVEASRSFVLLLKTRSKAYAIRLGRTKGCCEDELHSSRMNTLVNAHQPVVTDDFDSTARLIVMKIHCLSSALGQLC